MSESWDEYAENWDSNQSVIRYAEQAFENLINLTNIDDLTVLDFGCGTGLLTEKIATRAKSVIGLDTSDKMIAILKNKPLENVTSLALEVSEKTIKNSPELQGRFDLIVASSVMAFVENYHETLALLVSLLKPNGLFVQWDWYQTREEPDFGFTETKIDTAFSNLGMAPIKIGKAFSIESEHGTMNVIMGAAKKSA